MQTKLWLSSALLGYFLLWYNEPAARFAILFFFPTFIWFFFWLLFKSCSLLVLLFWRILALQNVCKMFFFITCISKEVFPIEWSFLICLHALDGKCFVITLVILGFYTLHPNPFRLIVCYLLYKFQSSFSIHWLGICIRMVCTGSIYPSLCWAYITASICNGTKKDEAVYISWWLLSDFKGS